LGAEVELLKAEIMYLTANNNNNNSNNNSGKGKVHP
jgi:hypothetical protein